MIAPARGRRGGRCAGRPSPRGSIRPGYFDVEPGEVVPSVPGLPEVPYASVAPGLLAPELLPDDWSAPGCDMPPVPLGAVEGGAAGVWVVSEGGVVVAGAEELGVVLLVPPVVPVVPPPCSPPPRLQAVMLRESRPSTIRAREACNFRFIAFPFY